MQSLAISLQVQLSSAQNDLADLRAEKEKLISERDVERQALQDALDAAIIERAENDAKWQRDFEQLRTLNSGIDIQAWGDTICIIFYILFWPLTWKFHDGTDIKHRKIITVIFISNQSLDREEVLLSDCEWKIRMTQKACKERINEAEQAKREAIKKAEQLAAESLTKQEQVSLYFVNWTYDKRKNLKIKRK